jgi:hypothetical protein
VAFLLLGHVYVVGHIAEACSSSERLCYNCRQPGHESAACPSPRTTTAKQVPTIPTYQILAAALTVPALSVIPVAASGISKQIALP